VQRDNHEPGGPAPADHELHELFRDASPGCPGQAPIVIPPPATTLPPAASAIQPLVAFVMKRLGKVNLREMLHSLQHSGVSIAHFPKHGTAMVQDVRQVVKDGHPDSNVCHRRIHIIVYSSRLECNVISIWLCEHAFLANCKENAGDS
jgi:hypothetical protein